MANAERWKVDEYGFSIHEDTRDGLALFEILSATSDRQARTAAAAPTAIDLLRRLVREYDEWRAICNICGEAEGEHADAVWAGHGFHLSPRVVNQRIAAAARPLLAAIDGAPAPAESEA